MLPLIWFVLNLESTNNLPFFFFEQNLICFWRSESIILVFLFTLYYLYILLSLLLSVYIIHSVYMKKLLFSFLLNNVLDERSRCTLILLVHIIFLTYLLCRIYWTWILFRYLWVIDTNFGCTLSITKLHLGYYSSFYSSCCLLTYNSNMYI